MTRISNSARTGSILALIISSALLSGCGPNKEKIECEKNMKDIGLAFRISEGNNNDRYELKPIANQLRARGLTPFCPSGNPYFICDFGSGDAESTPEKIIGYCDKHNLLLMGDGSVQQCNSGEFAERLKSSLFSQTNVSSALGQLVGNVSPPQAETVTDPDPTGTWTSGDKSSVYSRLTVNGSGTFRFETVDFTGDIKGGYSGTWKMNGNSIRFEWGSGRNAPDYGSCSGRKTGNNQLVFGSTTFRN